MQPPPLPHRFQSPDTLFCMVRLMLLFFFLLTLFLLPGCSHQGPDRFRVPVRDLKTARRAFHELAKALEKEGGKLWNHSLEGPVMIVNPDTKILLANRQDAEQELEKHGKLYLGRFPDSLNMANSVLDWKGERWTMVQWPLPETRSERLRLLIHESFHRIQPDIGFANLREAPNAHLDTRDGRLYLKLEMEALRQALPSDDPWPHLDNALLFRHYRHQLFPGAREEENRLEINEGVAEYTGSVLCGLSDTELRKHYREQIELLYTLPTFTRTFAYFAIPVYGYFLRQQDPRWNLAISDAANLTEYFSGKFRGTEGPVDSLRVTQAGQIYSIDSITAIETARESDRLQKLEKYKQLFFSDSIFVIPLKEMSIAFNARNSFPLDSAGIVYLLMRITDLWGTLEVDSPGGLVAAGWDRVTLTPPLYLSDSLVTGRGWKLKPKLGWETVSAGNTYRLDQKRNGLNPAAEGL